MKYAGFFLVILLSNIIQGITGFAGTILAMPPSLMLVGYDTAKPVLNVLGLLSGIYVLAENWKMVCWKEVRKIVIVMAAGIAFSMTIRGFFAGREPFLYKLLGIIVLALSVQGIYRLKAAGGRNQGRVSRGNKGAYFLLGLAGIIHGIFLSGGPLLISYLTGKMRDKSRFRTTISAVWVVLNTFILLDDIVSGWWKRSLIVVQLSAIPFLLLGMYLGSKLYVRMSQRLFMKVTYSLLFLSGIFLLIK